MLSGCHRTLLLDLSSLPKKDTLLTNFPSSSPCAQRDGSLKTGEWTEKQENTILCSFKIDSTSGWTRREDEEINFIMFWFHFSSRPSLFENKTFFLSSKTCPYYMLQSTTRKKYFLPSPIRNSRTHFTLLSKSFCVSRAFFFFVCFWQTTAAAEREWITVDFIADIARGLEKKSFKFPAMSSLDSFKVRSRSVRSRSVRWAGLVVRGDLWAYLMVERESIKQTNWDEITFENHFLILI